jgi:hypothetical protein
MKSIKQQYIDLREGNMSQANFMRNLRMTMPQYVTNVTSFEDSVRILKNKGILTEADMNVRVNPSELAMGVKVEMEHTDDVEVAKKIAMDHLAENPKYYSELKASGIDTPQGSSITSEPNLNKANPKDGFTLGFFEESEDKTLNEAKDEKGKWTNANGKSMYDQFKEIDNLNGHEVVQGIDWEMCLNQELTKKEAAKIVIKKLKKNPLYYTSWDMSGVEGYEPETMGPKSDIAARQMQPLEKNLGNIVDKKMGMKPVKDVEKVKKDADAKKETNKAVKNIDLMSLVAKTVRGLKKMDATGEKMKKVTMKEGFEDWLSNKRGEEMAADAASEVHNGLKIGDKVKINSEAANKLGISPEETFTIKSFRKIKPGSLMQSIDVTLADDNGNIVGDVNIEYVYEVTKVSKVASTIFNKNANITTGLNKLTKESLMQMIREELEEMFDGMEPMGRDDENSYLEETNTTDIENKIKSGEIDPKEVEAAAKKAMSGDSTDLAMLMAFGKKQ